MKPTRLMVCLLAAALLGSLAGCDDEKKSGDAAGSAKGSASAEKVLRFSAIPDQNATELKEKFDAVAQYLSGKLGVPVRYVHATDYKASVEMFKNGDVQLAWFGGLTGVQARHAVPGARAIVQGDTDPKFYSYFVAHKDTQLARSNQFPHHLNQFTFTFGPASSTSGRLMPEYYIRKESGKSPAEFFGREPGFTESHDQTLDLVQSGQVQVGVVNFEVYEKRVASGKTNRELVRVIWQTPTYADYNFTAHPDLEKTFGPGFIDRLQTALLEMKDPNLLAAFPRKELIKASDKDYAAVRQIAQQLGFLK